MFATTRAARRQAQSEAAHARRPGRAGAPQARAARAQLAHLWRRSGPRRGRRGGRHQHRVVFLVFVTQSFLNGLSLSGQAHFAGQPSWTASGLSAAPCERARRAYNFGLCTMVCVPVGTGVLELRALLRGGAGGGSWSPVLPCSLRRSSPRPERTRRRWTRPCSEAPCGLLTRAACAGLAARPRRPGPRHPPSAGRGLVLPSAPE